MTAAPVRNLLLGALFLVCAWVPAAMLAAPRATTTAHTVESLDPVRVHPASQVEEVASSTCPEQAPIQRS